MILHGGRADGHRPAQSPESLYDFDLATYDTGDTFDQSLAKGFIELWGLPVEDGRGPRPARRPERRVTQRPTRRRVPPVGGARPGCGAAGSPAARRRRWPR